MSIHIGVFQFSPSALPSFVVVLLLVLFISLGTWQLNRADEKRAILDNFEHNTRQSTGELTLPITEPEKWRYRKVRVSGRFDNDRHLFLDNQVNRGQVGVNVLTPLKLRYKEQAILVDRGWLPLGRDRSKLPDIDAVTQPIDITGTVYVPYKQAFHLGGIDDDDRFTWPRLIQYLSFDEISERLGYPVAPLTIRLDPASPHGYRRNWQPVPISPDTHTAYAMQWFTLAGVSIIIYFALSLKRNDNQEHSDG